jgi:predicted alpha/beta-fold hydrolase
MFLVDSTSGWIADIQHVVNKDEGLAILFGPIATLFFFFFITVTSLNSVRKSLLSLTRKNRLYTDAEKKEYKKRKRDVIKQYSTNQICSFLYVAYLSYLIGNQKNGINQIIMGNDPLMERVLELCPLIQRGPHPPFYLNNRHMQFVPWMAQNEMFRGSIPFETHAFTVHDCIDKSVPNCESHASMDEEITLDVFPPFDDPSMPKDAPVILFAPGLRCHSQDLPGNTIMRVAYGKGFRSIAVNRRGHHPTKEDKLLTAPRFNLFGDVDDLEQVYWHVKETKLPANTPMFLHGISSGCAVVVRALSLWDQRRTLDPTSRTPSFVGAVVLTPGYDTSKVLRPTRFKWPYNPLMNDAVKDHFIRLNEDVLRAYNSDAVDATLAAADMQSFLDAAAPFAGYNTAAEYYEHTNPVKDLEQINTPIYVLNSIDDPCCEISNLFEPSPHTQHQNKTYAQLVDKSQRGLIAITNSGSHCPFLDGGYTNLIVKDPLFGGYMLNSFADHSIVEFYEAVLTVYDDRRFM